MVMDDALTLGPAQAETLASRTDRLAGHPTLHFGLSLATALPPAAMLAPPGTSWPQIHPGNHPLVSTEDLASVLGRPIVEVGRGRATLGEVDRRLGGLEGVLSVFQVADRREALVCLSVVRSDRSGRGEGGVTPSDLWVLARQAVARYGVAHEGKVGVGDDAFVAIYGGVIVQVAWVTGDRVATASVTCRASEQAWAVDATRSVARLAERNLTRADGREPRLGRPGQ
jgi:hypothetical protein